MGKYKVDVGRLASAVNFAYRGMQVFRQERLAAVRRLAGNRYNRAVEKTTYLNLVSLYTNIISRALIAANPRICLTTFNRQAMPIVNALESWANEEIQRMDLATTIRRGVVDSLFGLCIAKVGIASPEESALVNNGINVGSPFAQIVDLNDYVFDIHAHDLREASWQGHRYRAPLDVVHSNTRLNKKRLDLKATAYNDYNFAGDAKITQLGMSWAGPGGDEFEDMVDMWEIYVPRHQCIYTFSDEGLSGAATEPLGEQEWIGPSTGPYRHLAMNLLPGNPFPKGPIQDVMDLDILANKIYRKLAWSAENQKEILLAMGNTEVIDRIQKTPHGGATWVDRPEQVSVQTYGNINQGLFSMLKETIGRFSWLAGNLETIGGLAPQAGTLGQEELLAKQSNAQVSRMQDLTVSFVSDVFSDILWWHYHHPTKVMRTKYEQPGSPEYFVTRELHPWNGVGQMRRNIPWEDLQMRVDPFSIQHQTPQQRAMTIQGLVTSVFMPMAQIAQQQGIAFNFQEFLSIMAKYTDQPDLTRILSIQDPPPAEEGAPEGDGLLAGPGGETPRVQVSTRRSLGPDSQASQEMRLNNMAAGTESMNGSL